MYFGCREVGHSRNIVRSPAAETEIEIVLNYDLKFDSETEYSYIISKLN